MVLFPKYKIYQIHNGFLLEKRVGAQLEVRFYADHLELLMDIKESLEGNGEGNADG